MDGYGHHECSSRARVQGCVDRLSTKTVYHRTTMRQPISNQRDARPNTLTGLHRQTDRQTDKQTDRQTDREVSTDLTESAGHVVERAHHPYQRVVRLFVGQLRIDRRKRQVGYVPVAKQLSHTQRRF